MRSLPGSFTEVIDEIAKFLSKFRLPGASSFGRNLHGNGVELGIVAVSVALHECLDLIVGRHQGTSSQQHASETWC